MSPLAFTHSNLNKLIATVVPVVRQVSVHFRPGDGYRHIVLVVKVAIIQAGVPTHPASTDAGKGRVVDVLSTTWAVFFGNNRFFNWNMHINLLNLSLNSYWNQSYYLNLNCCLTNSLNCGSPNWYLTSCYWPHRRRSRRRLQNYMASGLRTFHSLDS